MASTSGLLALFKELIDLLPVALISKNSEVRTEVIDVVSDLADELTRGLELATIRLQGAKPLDSGRELVEYLRGSRQNLFSLHSEFNICKGLRNLRAKQKTLFDKPTYAVEFSNRIHIEHLLFEMEKDERLIYDELGNLLEGAETRALLLEKGQLAVSDVKKWIAGQIVDLRTKQTSVRDLAREFIARV